jgi:hypothetical protein
MKPDSTTQLDRHEPDADVLASALLPGLPVELIRACYAGAPGNEIASGRFASPESSVALAANTFGPFMTQPADLPSFPGVIGGAGQRHRCALRRVYGFLGEAGLRTWTHWLRRAAQLVKHAFGLRTAVHCEGQFLGKQPVLLYLYAEPNSWPDGRPLSRSDVEAHRTEIRNFADMVAGDEVTFHACSYAGLLSAWRNASNDTVRAHAAAVAARFRL